MGAHEQHPLACANTQHCRERAGVWWLACRLHACGHRSAAGTYRPPHTARGRHWGTGGPLGPPAGSSPPSTYVRTGASSPRQPLLRGPQPVAAAGPPGASIAHLCQLGHHGAPAALPLGRLKPAHHPIAALTQRAPAAHSMQPGGPAGQIAHHCMLGQLIPHGPELTPDKIPGHKLTAHVQNRSSARHMQILATDCTHVRCMSARNRTVTRWQHSRCWESARLSAGRARRSVFAGQNR